MASGHLTGDSGRGSGSREKQRWVESKVYTRKSFKSSSKLNPSSQPAPPPPEKVDKVEQEQKVAAGDEGEFTPPPPAPPPPPPAPPPPPLAPPPQEQLRNSVASKDNVGTCTDVPVNELPREPLVSSGVVYSKENVGTCTDVPVNEPPGEPLVSYSVVNSEDNVGTCTDVPVNEPSGEPLVSYCVVNSEDNVGTCTDVPVNEPSGEPLVSYSVVNSEDNVGTCTDVPGNEPSGEPLVSYSVVNSGDNIGTCTDVPVNEPPREPLVSYSVVNGGQQVVNINLEAGSKEELIELRQNLLEELEKVRACKRKVKARELQLIAATVTPALPSPVTPGYSHSQLSASGGGVHPFGGGSGRRSFVIPETGSAGPPLHRQLSVSVATGQIDSYSMSDVMEKEKRTPKANQYYKNSDFLLAKDRIPPPPPSVKRSKSNVSKKHSGGYGMPDFKKIYAKAFTRCGVLLSKLMKHKFAWVFNTPVDAESLGLHDYYDMIKHPMDLGTIKERLSTNWYRSPREFAEDVRLTFNNAMTYNPKGQDVHTIAEELLGIFEERWLSIDSEFNPPLFCQMPSTKVPPPPLDMKRILERSESISRPVDSIPNSLSYTPHFGRTPAPRKPRAKDPHKREMTLDEVDKLNKQLDSLPPEKVDLVLQIINNRTTSNLSQCEGGNIEIDIDNLDTETLWELDRFMTNYKKNLSKRKRKAELAMLAKQEMERNMQATNMQNENPVVEKAIESETDKLQHVVSSSPICGEKKGDNESKSSSSGSGSSSSDSGSSSDSDSDSSSDDSLT